MFANRLSTCFIVLVFLSTTAVAQQGRNEHGWPEHFYQPAHTLPPDYGHTNHHDSTAYGNWLGGLARLRHADGTYLVNHTQAEILYEQSQALRTYNRRQWITFRVWNRERRVAELRAISDLKRRANLARRAARESKS
jgi:hypothetical protein